LCLEGLEERQVMSTLFLGGQAPGHFNSFADAYRAAHTGDVIQIEPGAVVSDPSGTIKLDKPITLQGDPLFDPAPVLSSMEMEAPFGFPAPGTVVLKNLNLGNKDVRNRSTSNDLTIQNSILHDVCSDRSSPGFTILNSTLHDATAQPVGHVTIRNSTLRSVDSKFVWTLVITGSTITGAVHSSSDCTITLNNNTFHVDGSAGHCAIELDDCQNATIWDNGIHFNRRDVDAKALVISASDVVINNTPATQSVFNNTFDTQNVGTGMEIDDFARVSIDSNDFNANAVGVHVFGFDLMPNQSVIDLGGGSLGSAGLNDFASYRGTDGRWAIVVDARWAIVMDAESRCTISALDNHWAPLPGWTSVDPRSVIQDNGCTIDVDVPMPLHSGGSGGGYGPGYHQPGTHPPVGGHIIPARPLVPRPLH
jgi:hypothetical protein